MLTIRLRKPGKSVKGRYHNKIVVIEKTKSREGKFVAQIGYYDPSHELLSFDIAKYENWIDKGAQPSETVKSLFKRYKKQKQKSE